MDIPNDRPRLSGELRGFVGAPLSTARVNLAIALFAMGIWWARVVSASANTAPIGDFPYFWIAARRWAERASAYTADYIAAGAARFEHFINPFFYPPQTPPLLSPLGLLPPDQAVLTLSLFSVAAALIISAMLARDGARYAPKIGPIYIFIILMLFLSVYMRPAIRVVIYGQITLLIALGFLAFLKGQQKDQRALSVLGLTALLIKPQFGIPIAIFAFLRQPTRAATLWAGAATAALVGLGLAYGHPIENLKLFIENISLYSSLPENRSGISGGLSLLYEMTGVAPPLTVRVLIACAPAFALAALAQSPRQAYLGACLVLVWAFIAMPSHSTDFVILFPAIIAVIFAGPVWARLLIGAAFIVLGRSWNIGRLLTEPGLDHADLVAFLHSAGLAALLVGLLALFLTRRDNVLTPA